MLKDDQAQVRCVLFRHKAQLLDVVLRDGSRSRCARPRRSTRRAANSSSTSRRCGSPASGALYERFARLKARLEAAGWFAAERKRALPAFPLALGIVTSLQAAALRDVLTTLGRRFAGTSGHSLSGAGAGRRCRGRDRRGDCGRQCPCRSRRPDRLPRRRLDRGPVGVQRRESLAPRCIRIAHSRSSAASGTKPTSRSAISSPTRARPRRRRGGAGRTRSRRACAAQAQAVFARWQHALARALELRMQRIDLVSRRLVHPAARIAAAAGRHRRAGRAARALGRAGAGPRQRQLAGHAAAIARLLQGAAAGAAPS